VLIKVFGIWINPKNISSVSKSRIYTCGDEQPFMVDGDVSADDIAAEINRQIAATRDRE